MTVYTEQSFKAKLAKLVVAYERDFEVAPLRREYIMGQNIPSKSDVRKAFAQNLANLINCAKLFIKVDGIIPKEVQQSVQAEATVESNPLVDALNDAD